MNQISQYYKREKLLIMSKWKKCKLGEVITLNYGKSLPAKKRSGGDIPVYSSAGLTGWHDKALVDSKGLIIGRKGTIGKVYKSENPFYAIDTSYYVLPNNDVYDFDFLFFLLGSIRLDELNEDSAVPGLNRNTAYSQDIFLPSLPEQRAIASILSSLDDKIDLHYRQNRTLEAMAETLFRQWFIEEAKEDWEEKPLDEIADYLNGLACQKFPFENDVDRLPVLKIKELRNGFTENSDWVTSKVLEQYIVKNGDVIFSWSGSLLVKIWNGKNCVLNQHLFKVTSEKYPKWFYYFWTKHHLQKFISIAESKATTMGHIKRGDLHVVMVLVPSKEETEEMGIIMDPIVEKLIKNTKQICTLEQLRDTLLPKLMSGVVRMKI